MSARLIESVPAHLRSGLPAPTATTGLAPVPTPRVRRVLTDAEAAALTDAGRHNARQRAGLLAEVGEAYLAALADGVL